MEPIFVCSLPLFIADEIIFIVIVPNSEIYYFAFAMFNFGNVYILHAGLLSQLHGAVVFLHSC